ncbi:MAG: RHS repeat-associated core domain-containing protein [Acidobacteria bacterium]|nr:RHS repeat-associated core domain-containing protein [Acidobacteriota bacterium]
MQDYTYDELNRLKSAVENVTPAGGTASQSWKQTFTFDRYGNRRFDEANMTMPSSFVNPAITNPTISASNNRLTSPGYSYDASGNTTADANGQAYVYDAENKMISASNSSGTLGEYFYDGDGKRVKKYVPSTGEVTIFVYDAAGKSIAEYSTIVEPAATAKISYLTNDHLGSPRVVTDERGTVTSRRDFMPFGEEIFSAGRITAFGYSADTIRQKFTGYQRDAETSLDFAQARMYANHLGRFTSVDPLYIEFRRMPFPQGWNLFAYTRNNPLLFTDPDGLDVAVNCKTDKKHVSACQQQTATNLNNRDGAQFKVAVKDGLFTVVGKVDPSKLSKRERKLYDVISDKTPGVRSTLNVEMSSDKITFGRFDGRGQNSVDLSDLSRLNSVDQRLPGEVIAHEVVEGAASGVADFFADNFSVYGQAHAAANSFFGAVEIELSNAPSLTGARIASREATYSFPLLTPSVSVVVTKRFKTPVPLASVTNATFPDLVGNIEKVTAAPTRTKPEGKP